MPETVGGGICGHCSAASVFSFSSRLQSLEQHEAVGRLTRVVAAAVAQIHWQVGPVPSVLKYGVDKSLKNEIDIFIKEKENQDNSLSNREDFNNVK